ncbi:MAG: SH3 domain-containing protein [Nostocaceae cyanobacterium]|nr:SH3 domain-containing protein [Nostocaceae cyanobacterium]
MPLSFFATPVAWVGMYPPAALVHRKRLARLCAKYNSGEKTMKRLLFVSLIMTTLAACQNPVVKTLKNAPASAKPAVEVNPKSQVGETQGGETQGRETQGRETQGRQTQGRETQGRETQGGQTPPLQQRRNCQFSAYVNDKDPKGLNVRYAPGSNQRVIAKLPRKDAIFVEIIACEGEWVQISKAESNDKVEFRGKGWVYAPLLGISTRGYGTNGVFLYASASTNSKKLTRIPADMAVKLLGGDGAWVFVKYQNLRGWLAPDDQCPNPLTTCS